MFKQGLYYKIDSRLQYLGSYSILFRLLIKHLQIETPIMLYTGTGALPLDHRRYQKMFSSRAVRDVLASSGICIFLYEPMSLYDQERSEHNRGYYSELPHNPCRKIYADELDSIKRFADELQISNVTVYTCDYDPDCVLIDQYPELTLKTFDSFLLNTGVIKKTPNFPKTIEYPFWCANARYTLPRHLSTAYLVNYPGVYSWPHNADLRKLLQTLDNNSWLDYKQLSNDIVGRLDTGNLALQYKKFRIDYTIESMLVESVNQCAIPSTFMNSNSPAAIASYQNCLTAVVNETRFAQPTSNISEKTLHAIAARTAFILVAPPRSLEYLKKLGFKTFDSYWDESYDQELDHTRRLIKLFKLFDSLGNMTPCELDSLNRSIEPVLLHNLRHLFSHFKKNLQIN